MLSHGHERTVRVKLNILGSFGIKGGTVLLNLLLIPLTIRYLNPSRYGVWLTLTSVVSWSSMFDLGLGHGLRNKLAEVFALGDNKRAKILVSTAYAIMGGVLLVAVLLFFLANHFLDWSAILNTSPDMIAELHTVAIVVFVLFCVQLWLQILVSVLLADQKTALSSWFSLLSVLLSLIFVFILLHMKQGSLLIFSIAFSAAPVVVYIFASLWLFRGRYKAFAPALGSVKLSHAKDIFSLGLKFFMIQASGVVLYSTSNILISQFGSPVDVTSYNVAYRYFSSVLILFTIVLSPLWTAYTESYFKNEIQWIYSILKKIIKIWFFLVLLIVVMCFASGFIIRIWIGTSVSISLLMTLTLALFTVFHSWCLIYVSLLNGVGKVKLQLYASIAGAVIFIPLSFIFAKTLNMGVIGVVASLAFLAFVNGIWMPIQTKKIMQKTDTGIWSY